jgi:hypothetical protein
VSRASCINEQAAHTNGSFSHPVQSSKVVLRLKEWMLEAGRSSALPALRLTTLAGRMVGQGSVSTQTGNADGHYNLNAAINPEIV